MGGGRGKASVRTLQTPHKKGKYFSNRFTASSLTRSRKTESNISY